jgi:hypothetical protein
MKPEVMLGLFFLRSAGIKFAQGKQLLKRRELSTADEMPIFGTDGDGNRPSAAHPKIPLK